MESLISVTPMHSHVQSHLYAPKPRLTFIAGYFLSPTPLSLKPFVLAWMSRCKVVLRLRRDLHHGRSRVVPLSRGWCEVLPASPIAPFPDRKGLRLGLKARAVTSLGGGCEARAKLPFIFAVSKGFLQHSSSSQWMIVGSCLLVLT